MEFGDEDADAWRDGGACAHEEDESEAEDDAEREFWRDYPAVALAAPAAAPAAAALEPRAAGRCDNVYTNQKAGMDGVDKEHVQRVVYELSKDSECVARAGAAADAAARGLLGLAADAPLLPRRVAAAPLPRRVAASYFKEARRRDAVTDARAAALAACLAALTPADLAAGERAAAARARALDAERDLSRTWLCVDMDAFYASVEIRDNPALAAVPMVRSPSARPPLPPAPHARARTAPPGGGQHLHDNDQQLRGAALRRARSDAGLHRRAALPAAGAGAALLRQVRPA
jgi:hypothetical protein